MPTNQTEREMVRVLAERVMGWRVHGESYDVRPNGPGEWVYPNATEQDAYRGPALTLGGTSIACRTWNPLESWADAGMLLEALPKHGALVSVGNLHDANSLHGVAFFSILTWQDVIRVFDESGPRAISLAAYEWAEAQKEQR